VISSAIAIWTRRRTKGRPVSYNSSIARVVVRALERLVLLVAEEEEHRD
jgi:hypothetical protein